MTVAHPVFVTGGSGVVGRAVVRRLVQQGRQVRALARSPEAAGSLQGLGAEPVMGDVLDPPSLDLGMAGCRVAYHVAGLNRFCLRDSSTMYRVNVSGSANVVAAAARASVERVVFTSSAVTLGEARGSVGREDSPHRGTFLSEYERSKFDAERLVFDMACGRGSNGLEVVSVNPSSVQGPGRSTGTGQVLIQYLRGRLRTWVDTTVSLVDIDDCAEGHLLAEAHGRAGERYVLNGASLDTRPLLGLLKGMTSDLPEPRLVPHPLAVAAVGLTELAARLRGRPPAVCRESLRTLLFGHRYDGSRAERELGLTYRPPAETLRRTALWLASEGLIPPSALAMRPTHSAEMDQGKSSDPP